MTVHRKFDNPNSKSITEQKSHFSSKKYYALILEGVSDIKFFLISPFQYS